MDNRAVRLPAAGAVIGIDVGFSARVASSAICRLGWDAREIHWVVRRFRATPPDQETTIASVAGSGPLQAVALDGPLRTGFDLIGRYRTAERMLTRRIGSRIGKPGQSSAPVGRSLNAAANDCARLVMRRCRIETARHAVAIDALAIVEAFPSAFLGVMIGNPAAVAASRSDRSDRFFEHLVAIGRLGDLISHLLPERQLRQPLDQLRNHDDRAALVCALTALSVAGGDFTAVGDADGWIILPPRAFIQEWALADLAANAHGERPGVLIAMTPGD